MKETTGKQKTKSNLLPREIKVNKTIMQKPQEIAKEFNKFFTSIGPTLYFKNHISRSIVRTTKLFFKLLHHNVFPQY